MSQRQWIRFEWAQSLTKTHVWAVVALESGAVIGQVRWHAPWRRYVFIPVGPTTIFDAACLLELQTFIDVRMRHHKAARKTARAAGEEKA